jgi:hypothetical protein
MHPGRPIILVILFVAMSGCAQSSTTNSYSATPAAIRLPLNHLITGA